MNIPCDEHPPKNLPGQWFPPPIELDTLNNNLKVISMMGGVFLVNNVCTEKDCEKLISAMNLHAIEAPVGVSGYSVDLSQPGSHRATAWAPELRKQLWQKCQMVIEPIRVMNEFTPTDWFALDGRKEWTRWQPVQMSPLLRFMRYRAGGQHYGHYDMGYDYGDGRRSLVSFVLYLTSVKDNTGGATRFLNDGQETIPIRNRNHKDWTRPATSKEVICSVQPIQGTMLFFDHRLCHDVELYTGATDRLIIRGDIVYWALE